MFFDGGSFLFNIFSLFFPIIFITIFIVIIVTIFKSISQWKYNNEQPILVVDAKIIAKRADVSTHAHHNNNTTLTDHHSSTTYYLTFEVESGSRMEFVVNGRDYGLLTENDHGKLKFQGTRFLGFERALV